jgi:hypothetical protein
MKPCLPEVHAALARAARCDPDHATRKWARKGLAAIGERCVAQCQVCGIEEALPARYVVPRPAIEPRILPPQGVPAAPVVPYEAPLAPPADEVMPPSELPPLPEASSPFSGSSSASRRDTRPRTILGRILGPVRSR